MATITKCDVTVPLEWETMRHIRAVAAMRGCSVSGLFGDTLPARDAGESDYDSFLPRARLAVAPALPVAAGFADPP